MTGRFRVPPHVTMNLLARLRWSHRIAIIGTVAGGTILVAASVYALLRGAESEVRRCTDAYATARTFADTLRIDTTLVSRPSSKELGQSTSPRCRALRAP